MQNIDTKIHITKEDRHEFNCALNLFVDAGYDLLKVWPATDVKNYPEYLPSFDEHLLHLRCIEPDDCDEAEEIAHSAITKAKGLTEPSDVFAFVASIAGMKQDGEDGFVMENDDAVTVLNELIDCARILSANTGNK